MERIVERVDVWAAGIKDQPGALAAKLSALAEAGADLDFIVSRRCADRAGEGVVFVSPLRGDEEVQAAGEVGFAAANSLHAVRVEGENRPGGGAKLLGKLGKAGLNVRGFSAAAIGKRYIAYIALDTAEDAAKAMKLLAGD
jgi:hypothetical protein